MDEQTRRRLQAVMRPEDLSAFAEIERAGRDEEVADRKAAMDALYAEQARAHDPRDAGEVYVGLGDFDGGDEA